MSLAFEEPNPLGTYLKDRRARLDPAALGFAPGRRRTPGLRREEVAHRASISATWYTWLEQGRGGAPSADTLDRIAGALMLTQAEREHLFLLGLGRPPEVKYASDETGVSPRLQRLLDAMPTTPALIKNATWDIVAWNRAAAKVLTDYGALAPEDRNTLKLMFCHPEVRAAQADWEAVARFVVGAFRADVARVGASEKVSAFVADLRRRSPEFDAFWREGEVQGRVSGLKELKHPIVGAIAVEFSVFVVDGRPDLALIVYNPVTDADAEKVRALLDAA